MTTYTFSADHVVAEYCFVNEPIRVGQDSFYGTYYAAHGKLGCGRNYQTPETAIRELVMAHGCYNVRIHAEG